MPANPKRNTEEKIQLHQRNKHRLRYDFPELVKTCPELESYVFLNQYNDLSIDFKDADAVKMLNKALLKYFYSVAFWDIPEGYLCPPIPGRADYIHYAADLLAATNNGIIPRSPSIKVLDIGTGANCIYSLIGNKEYGWNFVGSDIDRIAIRSAKNILAANALSKGIAIRKQESPDHIFTGIINKGERFDVTICNPPFHASLKDATEGTERKWKNLDKAPAKTLNFGGRGAELWCAGGEAGFVKRMIFESAQFPESCLWFTSLISKKETLAGCYKALELVKAAEVKTINMAQGQKISRILAWSFLDKQQQQDWAAKYKTGGNDYLKMQ